MIKLLFVADGPRDAVTVPRMVEGILHVGVKEDPIPWARLHQSRGYGRKLRFAIRQARDRRRDGLVATVDADRDRRGQRIKELKDARAADRASSPHLPVALGQAQPHLEAWLLDDPVAVREGLRLAKHQTIDTVRQVNNPKETLEKLLSLSPRSSERPLGVWPDIARRVEASHCRHAKETGFAGFVEEVRCELGPVSSPDA